jgi:D-alanyl-D-alanine carboxypeptidase/D-alanyl-D-alanine-endopeptidase (penicillin-binding protein 4)
VAVAAGLLVLGLVSALAVVRPWAGSADPVLLPPPSAEPPPVAVLPAIADGDAPAPTADGVRAAIDELVRTAELGSAVSAAVVDPVTGEQLYGHRPGAPTVPASAIKLVTAATLLAAVGPAHQLSTVAVAGAETGEVVLVGGGDPTLAVTEEGFYPDAARLDQLAEQVRQSLGDTPVRKVTVDATLFRGPVHGPWSDDIIGGGFVAPITALMTDGGRVDPDPAQEQRPAQRWSAPDLAAGEAFAGLLGLGADTVTRGEAPPPPAAPGTPVPGAARASGAPASGGAGPAAPPVGPGAELGRVSSPPILRLVEYMLASSDNVVAEALARQVALARGEPASFEGAAAAMVAGLAQLGVPVTAGVTIADGSGLSRDNRLTAGLLTDLLMAATTGAPPALTGLAAGLPVAGWSGTLVDRYRPSGAGGATGQPPPAGPGAGVVRAKTGSLDGVNALTGLVVTGDGRLLVFALLTDAVPVSPEQARQALDEVAVALAGCGCR